MKTKELRELGKQELLQKLKESKTGLLKLRIQRANQQLKNILRLRFVRRDIARIKTILQEKKGDK